MGFLALTLTVLTIIDIEAVCTGVFSGLIMCAKNIVPSLLIFFIMSELIVNSIDLNKFSPKWTAFIIGSVCGFPIGARICTVLHSKGAISNMEFCRIIPLCNNTSPAFVIGAIGTAMLSSKELGILLYFSEIIAALILILPIKIAKVRKTSIQENECDGNLFFSAIEAATLSILKICTIICFFSGILSMISKHFGEVAKTVFSTMLEIGSGSMISCTVFNQNRYIGIILLGFICGWSGICVHLQILSICRSIKVKYISLLKYKFIHGILSSSISFVGYILFFTT